VGVRTILRKGSVARGVLRNHRALKLLKGIYERGKKKRSEVVLFGRRGGGIG